MPDTVVKHYQLADVYGDTTTEGRVITLEFEGFFVVSVYTPNAKDDLSRIAMRQAWDPAFRDYIAFLQTQKPVLVGGDFNVAHTALDLARPKENEGKKGYTTEERTGFGDLLDIGLLDTFRTAHPGETGHYTWWSHWGGARERNVGWRIDYWLASASLQPAITTPLIHPTILGSDHCPVSLQLDESKIKPA